MDKWKKQHEQTGVKKLMAENALTLSRHITFLTLTIDGLWKKALEKGQWLVSGKL